MVARKIKVKKAVVNIIGQIIGAVIGSAVVYTIFGPEMSASVTLPLEDNVVRAPILETVMTITFAYVVLATPIQRILTWSYWQVG